MIDLAALIGGFEAAMRRFHAAAGDRDPAETFRPLFEALAWSYSIDEKLKRPAVTELRGLRFARGRVHHRRADALYVDDVARVTVSVSTRSRLVTPLFFEWRWRPELARVMERGNPDRDAYVEHLSGQPARNTLERVMAYLRTYCE